MVPYVVVALIVFLVGVGVLVKAVLEELWPHDKER